MISDQVRPWQETSRLHFRQLVESNRCYKSFIQHLLWYTNICFHVCIANIINHTYSNRKIKKKHKNMIHFQTLSINLKQLMTRDFIERCPSFGFPYVNICFSLLLQKHVCSEQSVYWHHTLAQNVFLLATMCLYMRGRRFGWDGGTAEETETLKWKHCRAVCSTVLYNLHHLIL